MVRRAVRSACIGLLAITAFVWAFGSAHALNPKNRNAVRDAFRAAEHGEWQRAFRLVEGVTDPLPAKALRWLRMIEEEGPESFDDYARFLITNPDWPLQEQMQFLAERRIIDPADHALIRRFFRDRPPLTTRGHIRYAEALLDVGEDERAAGLLRRAWVEGDFSRSEGRKFYDLYGHLLGEDDHVARLDNLLWDYRRRSASRMLELVPAGHRRLGEARLRLQRRQHGVDRAIAAVPGELRNDPGLVFDRLRWRRQKRRHDDAMEILLDPPAELDRPGMWWFEREFQLRRALRQRDFDLAYRLASRHGQKEGRDFAEAEWLAGWLALRFVDLPREALRRFERLYAGVTTPISRARAAYWAGRAAAALEDHEHAATWYHRAMRLPITYYGQRAAEELGEPLPGLDVLPPTRAQRTAFESKELTRLVRLLIGVEAREHISPFLIRLAGDAATPSEVGLVGDLAAASERPDLVTMVGKFAAYDGIINAEVAFPIPDIEAMTEPIRGQPDPALVLAVARQESLFDTRVMSRAGARGLLQLMPRTASLMARDLGLRYNTGLLTWAPEYNVRLGRHYLGRMIERFDELGLAFAAYNAGPSRVERWLDLHGDPRGRGRHALIDWVELIPFDETRNYVQRVLENHVVYRARFAENSPTRVSFLDVNGPIAPTPRPALKPRAVVATLNAPTPALKPIGEARVVPAGYTSPPIPTLKPQSDTGTADAAPIPLLKPSDLAARGPARRAIGGPA